MTMVETRVQDGIFTAIEILVFPGVELPMKSVDASSGRVVGSTVLHPDQKDFSEKIEGLQLTACFRKNSRKDLNRIDETHGSTAVEGGDLTVNEGKFDRSTETHHSFL